MRSGVNLDAIVHGYVKRRHAGRAWSRARRLSGSATRIMGVNVYKKNVADIADTVHALAIETMHFMGVRLLDVSSRLHVIDGYQGEAMAFRPPGCVEAVLSLPRGRKGCCSIRCIPVKRWRG